MSRPVSRRPWSRPAGKLLVDGVHLRQDRFPYRGTGPGQRQADLEVSLGALKLADRQAAPFSPTVPAIPGCGPGARVRKVVATYSARKQGSGGYRTDTLYCGVAGLRGYGYRHLLPHVGQYFGGWPSFSFAMAQTLKAPAAVIAQSNGNYLESAPIFQCFYQGYYIIWTFFVVPQISSGTIITAYGRKGKTVNQSCP